MKNLEEGELKIQCEQPSPQVIRINWLGKSVDRQPRTVLNPYFAEIFSEAIESKSTVEMHFERLEYFNSSTITAVIQLIQLARQRGVRMKLVYDDSLKWQRISFEPLKIFGKDGDSISFARSGV
jgi:hypothetical protein